MRVAILADIHGNLPACEAVLADVARSGADVVVAAGDLALRGAHPRETVELLDDRCDVLLMGNTDCYVAGTYLGGAYRERDHWKRDLLDWTREQLGPAWTKRLGELPFSVRYAPRRGQDLYVCHANPRNLEESIDPTLDETALRRFFAHLDAAAVAFGHLHFPYRRRFGRMLLADVASAGIPRDGDVRPAYGVFTWTPRGWRVQIRRVRYSIRRATQALTARRVPGGPLLVHKMLEARYRHHVALLEAARRHSGLPRPPGATPVSGAAHHLLRPPADAVRSVHLEAGGVEFVSAACALGDASGSMFDEAHAPAAAAGGARGDCAPAPRETAAFAPARTAEAYAREPDAVPAAETPPEGRHLG